MDNIIISNSTNIEYLTGFAGTYGFLVVLNGQKYLFTDSRYYERAKNEVKAAKVCLIKNNWPEILLKYRIKNIGFEANSVSYNTYLEWKSKIKKIRLIPTKDVVEKIRQIKNKKEINAIKHAIRLSEKILSEIKIKLGVSELELKRKLEGLIRDIPFAAPSFNTIVAFGANSSMPHALPSNKKLLNNRMIKIDFGVKQNGYCSDLTRTFWKGKITGQFKKIYNIVLSAQELAIEGIKPGRKICEIDALARDYINKEGFGRFFGHSLGHGIGMSVHEMPRISYKDKEKLQEGMVFSIEPGIYIPGWGGVRIEDLVLVKENGCELLTKYPKQLDEVVL